MRFLPLFSFGNSHFYGERRMLADKSPEKPSETEPMQEFNQDLIKSLRENPNQEMLEQMTREFLSDDGELAMQGTINEVTTLAQRIELLLPEDKRETLREVIPTTAEDMIQLLIDAVGVLGVAEYGDLVREATRREERSKAKEKEEQIYIQSLLDGSRASSGNITTRYDKVNKKRVTLVRQNKNAPWQIGKEETVAQIRRRVKKFEKEQDAKLLAMGIDPHPQEFQGRRLPKWITGEKYRPGEREGYNMLALWGRDRQRFANDLRIAKMRDRLGIKPREQFANYVGLTPDQYAEMKRQGWLDNGREYVQVDAPGKSRETSSDRARNVAESLLYDEFIRDVESGAYEKYKGLPGYEDFMQEVTRKVKYWEMYPDRNTPEKRYGDLARIRALKGEMDRRLVHSKLNQDALNDMVRESEEGGVGALEMTTVEKPGGFNPKDVITITYTDPDGVPHNYTYKPYYVMSEGAASMNHNMATEALRDLGLVFNAVEADESAYADGRKIIKKVDIYFRKPGVFTVNFNRQSIPIVMTQPLEYAADSEGRVTERVAAHTDVIENRERVDANAFQTQWIDFGSKFGAKAQPSTLMIYNDARDKTQFTRVDLNQLRGSSSQLNYPEFTVFATPDPNKFEIGYFAPGEFRTVGTTQEGQKIDLASASVAARSVPSQPKSAPSIEEAREKLSPLQAELDITKARLKSLADNPKIKQNEGLRNKLLHLAEKLSFYYPATETQSNNGARWSLSFDGITSSYVKDAATAEQVLNDLFREYGMTDRIQTTEQISLQDIVQDKRASQKAEYRYLMHEEPTDVLKRINTLLAKVEKTYA